MRLRFFFIIMLAILFAACSTKTVNTDDILSIDLSKSYPQKEIHLQSIAEIEYVALETTGDALLDESFQISSLSDKFIVGWQNRSNTKEVFVFDRNGKFVSKFNKFGQSGAEYNHIDHIVFDEKNEEIFVVDNRNTYRIQVYTFKGEYKRTLNYSDDFSNLRSYNFDDETLLIYDDNERNSFIKRQLNLGISSNQYADREQPYMLMSKKDGTVISELNILLPKRYAVIVEVENRISLYRSPNNRYHGQDFVIADISSDTIYKLSKNNELMPLFIRKPSVHSTARLVVWSSFFITDKFAVLNKVSINESSRDLATAFSSDTLMYVFSTGETNKVSFVNDDFQSIQWTPTIGVQLKQTDIVVGLIQMSRLFDAYEKKQLKGELAKLVAKLDEEDNPVVMIVKFK